MFLNKRIPSVSEQGSINGYAIEVNELKKSFGSLEAVRGVSFKVPGGSIFGLLGPNGSGKSTTIRMLCGLMRPSSGTGCVLGFDIMSQAENIKAGIGYMSQKFSLYEDLTIAENIGFFGNIYGLKKSELNKRREELYQEMNIGGRVNQIVGTLSGGWKQRLALACAFIHQPRLLVLDEPTAGVDPVSRRLFWDLLFSLSDKGVTVLVTTHYMDEAENCHLVALMNQGLLYAFGTPQELKEKEGRKSLEEVFINMAASRR